MSASKELLALVCSRHSPCWDHCHARRSSFPPAAPGTRLCTPRAPALAGVRPNRRVARRRGRPSCGARSAATARWRPLVRWSIKRAHTQSCAPRSAAWWLARRACCARPAPVVRCAGAARVMMDVTHTVQQLAASTLMFYRPELGRRRMLWRRRKLRAAQPTALQHGVCCWRRCCIRMLCCASRCSGGHAPPPTRDCCRAALWAVTGPVCW